MQPFFPDTFYGQLMMWPLLLAVALSLFTKRGRDIALYLFAYWLAVRWLVSTTAGDTRMVYSIVLHATAYSFSIFLWMRGIAGKIIVVTALMLLVTAVSRLYGNVSPGDAGILFDLFFAIQIITLFVAAFGGGGGFGFRSISLDRGWRWASGVGLPLARRDSSGSDKPPEGNS